ncbi:MAG TPA: nicotinate-nucleotide--dimethylbenzimidazole phosphoribosyltransferase [Chloroflexota bacterium]|nr:nicotinate-nucleotide--dimethylbenzimidazole phosphoribosyltransferase [Chloroflexota bacterium]
MAPNVSPAESEILAVAGRIQPPDLAAAAEARARQAQLTKPAGSLGRLEDLAMEIAGLTGSVRPQWQRRLIVVFAADHGVAAEGVSAYPSAVTPQMVLSFARGTAAVCALARAANARLVVVDVGVAATFPADLPIVHAKVRAGTASFVGGPAISRDEAIQAMRVGTEVVATEVARGVDLLALGDMGIGNTTAAAALVAALLGLDAAEVVGRGTGVDDEGLRRKIAVVRRGLDANRPDPGDPIGVLAAVGGLEIAAMAGAMLRAAAARIPVLLDGYICGAAALVAGRLAPTVRPYLIAAHRSTEPGHRRILSALELEPLLDLGMRLGEASGAALALPIVAAALATHDQMATFADAGVSTALGSGGP